MGAVKFILVLVILFTFCEDIESQQESTATVLNTRFKRETENDRVSKEQIPKITFRRQPIRPFIPTTKILQPTKAFPANPLTRRNFIPVVNIKPNLVTRTKNKDDQNLKPAKIVSSNSTVDSNATKLCNESLEITGKTIEPENNPKEMANNKINKFAKTEDFKSGLDTITSSEEKNCEKSIQIEQNKTNKTEIGAKTEKIVDKKAEVVPIKEVIPIKLDLDITLPKDVPNFKIVPGIPIKRIGKLAEEAQNNLIKIEQENNKVIKDDMVIKPASHTKKNTENKDIGESLQTIVGPLFPLVDETKMPVSKIKPLQDVKIIDKSAASSSQNIATFPSNLLNEDKLLNKQELDLTSLGSSKEDSNEEIVIENHNYEELYENVTRGYFNPSLVTSELRSGPLFYENYKPCDQFDIPYSYDISKVGNQFVIDAIDNIKSENEDSNYIEDESCTCKDNYGQSTDNLNCNMLYKNYKAYNQYQPQLYRQGANFGNYKTQGYPNRIWRSWKNNQIFIRPKSGDLANTELYKGLGNYLANFNTQSMPVYNPSTFNSPCTYENQNTSPHLIPFQYNRYYGY